MLHENRISELQKILYFHIWDDTVYEVRFICAFDLNSTDIDRFISGKEKLADSAERWHLTLAFLFVLSSLSATTLRLLHTLCRLPSCNFAVTKNSRYGITK